MSEPVLTETRIRAGLWEGVLSGSPAEPVLDVTWLDTLLPGVSVSALPDAAGAWTVRVPIPGESLNDGVQTFVITDRATGAKRGQFTLIAGAALDGDLRAEIDLLRAELDLLKRAFRRHCMEA